MEAATETTPSVNGSGGSGGARTVVKQEALALPDQARALSIENDEQYQAAALFLRECCKAVLKRADEIFDPIIASAHATHKEAVAQKRAVTAPIEEAERIVKDRIAGYLREQDRKRLEAQRVAEEAARKLAEEEALLKAEALQNAGRTVEADAVLEQPLAPLPVIVSAPPPRAEGVARRTNYRAVVTDMKALVKHVAAHPEHSNLLLPNGPALNQLAKSLKGDLSIPGVRVMTDDVISARS